MTARTESSKSPADLERIRLAGCRRAVEIAAGHDIAVVVADADDVVAVPADERRAEKLAGEDVVAVVAEDDVVEPEGGGVVGHIRTVDDIAREREDCWSASRRRHRRLFSVLKKSTRLWSPNPFAPAATSMMWVVPLGAMTVMPSILPAVGVVPL